MAVIKAACGQIWSLDGARGLGGNCSGDARPFEELRTRYPAPTHSDIVIKADKFAAIKTLCATFHSLTAIYSLLAIATSFDLENGLSLVFILPGVSQNV